MASEGHLLSNKRIVAVPEAGIKGNNFERRAAVKLGVAAA